MENVFNCLKYIKQKEKDCRTIIWVVKWQLLHSVLASMRANRTGRLVKFQTTSDTELESPTSKSHLGQGQSKHLHISTQRHFVGHKNKLSHQGGSKFQGTGQISPLFNQSVECSLAFLSCPDTERRKRTSL